MIFGKVYMVDRETRELDNRLLKAARACKIIRVVFLAALIVYGIFWLSALTMSVHSVLSAGKYGDLWFVTYSVVHGLLVFGILLSIIFLLSTVANGKPPLSIKQADRLKQIAGLAFALVVIELAFSAGIAYQVIPQLGLQVFINDGIAASTIDLNVGMLAFSAIMYSLSAIFRYAALLQQLSDETV
ncbi:hypothetical protein [Adlercreutzia equolifaciens]|uniref:hypothetical protein n=1 Tax=Adlercreutzia equolifaciens TaxID=446660 RepID=UPI0022E637A9|nr:hypothetical protein [Adlercreutzia equolifaciens]